MGDYFIPYNAVREEAMSDQYTNPKVLAVPNLGMMQELLHHVNLTKKVVTGIIHTTTFRFWEVDGDDCHRCLAQSRHQAVDMETATIFAAAQAQHLRVAGFHMVSNLTFEHVQDDKNQSKQIMAELAPKHIKDAVKFMVETCKTMRTKGLLFPVI